MQTYYIKHFNSTIRTVTVADSFRATLGRLTNPSKGELGMGGSDRNTICLRFYAGTKLVACYPQVSSFERADCNSTLQASNEQIASALAGKPKQQQSGPIRIAGVDSDDKFVAAWPQISDVDRERTVVQNAHPA